MPTKKRTDAPQLSPNDSLTISVIKHPFSFKQSKNKKLNELIVSAIHLMGATGENANKQYQRCVKKVRKECPEAIRLIVDEYWDCEKSKYLDRWSLIQLLCELEDPACLNDLNKIIGAKLPRRKAGQGHRKSDLKEEVIIRATAVEGVCRLAKNKNRKAVNVLLDCTSNSNFSIKRAAIQGYLEYGGKNAAGKLKKALPKKMHALLAIKRMDVREVPQAEGGLFLKTKDKDALPPLK